MNDGITFDNFIIIDDKQVADDFAEKTWKIKTSAEERKFRVKISNFLFPTTNHTFIYFSSI